MDKKCKNYQAQRLYCQLCCEEGRHNHYPSFRILPKMSNCRKLWMMFMDEANDLNDAINYCN